MDFQFIELLTQLKISMRRSHLVFGALILLQHLDIDKVKNYFDLLGYDALNL